MKTVDAKRKINTSVRNRILVMILYIIRSPLYIFSQDKRRNNNTINSNNKSKSNKDINIDTSLSREENKYPKEGDIINIIIFFC